MAPPQNQTDRAAVPTSKKDKAAAKKEAKKKEKESKKEKECKKDDAQGADLDIRRVDIRVGRIVEAKKHPNADRCVLLLSLQLMVMLMLLLMLMSNGDVSCVLDA